MKPIFIKLTDDVDDDDIYYVNVATIETMKRAVNENGRHTYITFSDGALEIKETPEEILELIKNAR